MGGKAVLAINHLMAALTVVLAFPEKKLTLSLPGQMTEVQRLEGNVRSAPAIGSLINP